MSVKYHEFEEVHVTISVGLADVRREISGHIAVKARKIGGWSDYFKPYGKENIQAFLAVTAGKYPFRFSRDGKENILFGLAVTARKISGQALRAHMSAVALSALECKHSDADNTTAAIISQARLPGLENAFGRKCTQACRKS